MAKLTKKAIMHSLLELLKTKSIDRITVKDICDDCEINRNTFYYYYKDIYDVINSILLQEIENNKLDVIHKDDSFYDKYRKAASIFAMNKDVVLHIYNSKNRDIITNYLEKVTAQIVKGYIAAKSEGKNVSDKNLEFMSHFYCYAIAGSTYKWLDSGMQADFEQFVKKIAVSIDATLPVMIDEFVNN